MEDIAVYSRNSGLVALIVPQHVPEKVGNKACVVAFEVRNVEGRVKGPVVLLNIENFPESAVAPSDDPWALRLRLIVTPGDTRRGNNGHITIVSLRFGQVVAARQRDYVSKTRCMPPHAPNSSKFF